MRFRPLLSAAAGVPLALGLAGCGDSAPAAAEPSEAARVLEEANELVRTHHVAPALERIDLWLGDAPGDAAITDENRALLQLRASLLLTLSRPEEAAQLLERLRAGAPDSAGLTRQLAKANLERGRHAEAVKAFEELPPRMLVRELLSYAEALIGAGDATQGAAAAAAALSIDPWLEEGYLVLGRTLSRLGFAESAEELLSVYQASDPWRQAEQRALDAESSGAAARADLVRGRAEIERGRLYEALRHLDQAMASGAEDGVVRRQALFAAAEIALRLARTDQVAELLRPYEGNPAAWPLLAEARVLAGDRAGAVALLERAASVEGGPDVGARLDELRAAPAEPTAVDAAFERVLAYAVEAGNTRSLVDSAEALFKLAQAHWRAERIERARELLLLVVQLAPSVHDYRLGLANAVPGTSGAFVRLWALAPLPDRGSFERRTRILEELGVNPGEVARAAAGEPLSGPR